VQIFEYSNGVELVDSNERETVDVTPVLRSIEPQAFACSRCGHHLQRDDLPELTDGSAAVCPRCHTTLGTVRLGCRTS
jgi:uncharacterized paraquat-inducible protein A